MNQKEIFTREEVLSMLDDLICQDDLSPEPPNLYVYTPEELLERLELSLNKNNPKP
jgi:hypothetical protein